MLSPGDVIFLNALSANTYKTIKDITRSLDTLTDDYGSMQKALDVLLVLHDMTDAPDAKNLLLSSGAIDIKNLAFAYPNGQSVFSEMNLSIVSKTKIGLYTNNLFLKNA